MTRTQKAFVTLAFREIDGLGCLILGHSLRQNTENTLVALTTNELSLEIRDLLSNVYDEVIEVPLLNGSDSRIKRPGLSSSLTKIECWNLTKYSKCVFLDCDTMVLQNCDELFDMEELSAVPDIGWPDCFNTGVFVYSPSNSTYQELISLAADKGSFDGGEHGLLNSYFGKDWLANLNKRLSVAYNVVVGYIYTYSPAFKKFGGSTKIAHFIGHPKPWMAPCNFTNENLTAQNVDCNQNPFLQSWLNIFRDKIYGQLPEVCKERAANGHIDTAWNFLKESKNPDHCHKKNEVPPEVFHVSVPDVFTPQYRQPFHELQPMQYSDQIKADFRSDTTSPIRSTTQAQRQAAFIMTSPLPEPFIPPQRNSAGEFTYWPRKSPTPESSTSQASSGRDELGATSSLAETTPSVRPKKTASDVKSRKRSDMKRTETLFQEDSKPPGRMKDWEEGRADYMGRDKFENIQKKLDVLFQERSFEDESEYVEIRKLDDRVQSTKRSTTEPKKLDSPTDIPGYQINDFSGMHDWESGRIDYTGRHSCDNIIARLDFLFSQGPDVVPRK
uniref:glycogenin glucosyltransferase n=1 Tax=Strigamia maritima TaxID=126957 RepID=T1J521_STRMM